MSSKTAPDGSDGGRVPFGCSWRREATGAASVQVSGELDVATASRLEATLLAARAHARLVLLDLREVSFMDCSAVHVIVDASRVARPAGARLLVAGTSERVDVVFEMTGMSAEV